jgi:hypothetical protein
MLDRNQKKLGDLIKGYIREAGLEEKLNEAKIIALWEEKMGTSIKKHTKKITLKKSTVTIQLDSAVLRQEFLYGKSNLIEMFNTELGSNLVKDVVLR